MIRPTDTDEALLGKIRTGFALFHRPYYAAQLDAATDLLLARGVGREALEFLEPPKPRVRRVRMRP